MRKRENQRTNQRINQGYNQRIIETENGFFNPLLFACTGGMWKVLQPHS